MIGSMVAHYRITGKIGEGGMGVVYKADDTKLERVVALKFLPDSAMPETSRQRFLQEARAAARIQHPNISPIFEINEHEGRPFFAMAFLEGKPISELLETGPLPYRKAVDIALQIAAGLEAAHQHGIVHRDIKSSNIQVGPDGHVSILDFGLALRQDSERLTTPGLASGTAAYMSPEQAQGLEIDLRSDLWSLGVVLYEMLTGKLPFHRESVLSVMYAIVNQEPLAFSPLGPSVPKSLEAVLNRALAKDPRQRFQSATEMADALRRVRNTTTQETQTVTSFQTIVSAKSAWAKVDAWKYTAAIVLLAAVAWLVWRHYYHPAVPLPQEKKIAVLSFEIIGAQSDDSLRALADGLTESITAKLSQVEDFQGKLLVPASEIRSRKINNAADALRLYGANLVLTGSAQRWNDKIQFNEVLEDTASVKQLGSTSFEFTSDKATAGRDLAVDGAIHLLQVKLRPATVTALDAGETSVAGAYGDYLRGIGYLARYDLTGNVDRAIGSLENAISADPKYALAHAALGEAHWRKAKITSDKKESDLALKSIQLALRLDSRLTAAHVELGEIYSESGEPDLAITEAKNALEQAPNSAEAYRVLGAAYAAKANFSEAEAAYQKSIACQKADWYGYFQLGFFYVQRGRLADARTAFETARELTPNNAVVLANLTVLDMREGKFKEAADLCRETLKFDTGYRTYVSLGLAYYYLRQYQEAAAAMNTSVKLSPTYYQGWGNLGTIYRHLPGSEDKARQSFLKAIELASKTLEVLHGDLRAHANLAEYYAKLGDTKKAMAEIDQIPEASRGPFIDRIILVYQFSGDHRRAAEMLRSIPENSPVINYLKNDPDLAGSSNDQVR
jgi:serine/threonine-protein kinase